MGPLEAVAEAGTCVIEQARVDTDAFDLEARLHSLGLVTKVHGEQQRAEELAADDFQMLLQPVDGDRFDRPLPEYVKEIRQPRDMIEVDVREEDMQARRLQVLADAEEAGAGIQNEAMCRQHVARRVPVLVWVIAGRAEQTESHLPLLFPQAVDHATPC